MILQKRDTAGEIFEVFEPGDRETEHNSALSLFGERTEKRREGQKEAKNFW